MSQSQQKTPLHRDSELPQSGVLDYATILRSDLVQHHPPLRRMAVSLFELLHCDPTRMEFFEFELDEFHSRATAAAANSQIVRPPEQTQQVATSTLIAHDASQYSNTSSALVSTSTLASTTTPIPPFPVIHKGTWARVEWAVLEVESALLNAVQITQFDARLVYRLQYCCEAWRSLENDKVSFFEMVRHERLSGDGASNLSKSITQKHLEFVESAIDLFEIMVQCHNNDVEERISLWEALRIRTLQRTRTSKGPRFNSIIGATLLTPLVLVAVAKHVSLARTPWGGGLLFGSGAVGVYLLDRLLVEARKRDSLNRVANVLIDASPIEFPIPSDESLAASGLTNMSSFGDEGPPVVLQRSGGGCTKSDPPTQHPATSWQREMAWRCPSTFPAPIPKENVFLYHPRSDCDDGTILSLALSHQCPTPLHQRRLLAKVAYAQSLQFFEPFGPVSVFFPDSVLQGHRRDNHRASPAIDGLMGFLRNPLTAGEGVSRENAWASLTTATTTTTAGKRKSDSVYWALEGAITEDEKVQSGPLFLGEETTITVTSGVRGSVDPAASFRSIQTTGFGDSSSPLTEMQTQSPGALYPTAKEIKPLFPASICKDPIGASSRGPDPDLQKSSHVSGWLKDEVAMGLSRLAMALHNDGEPARGRQHRTNMSQQTEHGSASSTGGKRGGGDMGAYTTGPSSTRERLEVGADLSLGVNIAQLIQADSHNNSSFDTLSSSGNATHSTFDLGGTNITVLFVRDGVVESTHGARLPSAPLSMTQQTPLTTITQKPLAAMQLNSVLDRTSTELARPPILLFVVACIPNVVAEIVKQLSLVHAATVPMESMVLVLTHKLVEVTSLLASLVCSKTVQNRPHVLMDLSCKTGNGHHRQIGSLGSLLHNFSSHASTSIFSSQEADAEENLSRLLSSSISATLVTQSIVKYPLSQGVVRLAMGLSPVVPFKGSDSSNSNQPPPSSTPGGEGVTAAIGKPPLGQRNASCSQRSSPSNAPLAGVQKTPPASSLGPHGTAHNTSPPRQFSHPHPSLTPTFPPPPNRPFSRVLSVDSSSSAGALIEVVGRSGRAMFSDSLSSPSPHLLSGSARKRSSAHHSLASSNVSDSFHGGTFCKIIKCIGHGTFGVVYLGRLRHIPAYNVAIKQFYLKLGEEEELLVDIAYEAALLRALDHPNIVRYYDSFVSENCVNIVMQYCNGGNLNLRIGSIVLRSEEFLMIMRDILEGLAYLHTHCIMHRDLKPENVLFHNGVPMIADFGTATKSNAIFQDGSYEVKGSFAYMAPEVLLEERYDLPCDIWSIGCIFADLIGVPLPQRNMDLRAIRQLYTDGCWTSSSGSRGVLRYDNDNSLPEEMRAFFDACFEADWTKRASAAELREFDLMNDPAIITEYQKQLQAGHLEKMSLAAESVAEAKRLRQSERSESAARGGARATGDDLVLYSVANRSQVVERYLRNTRDASALHTPTQSITTLADCPHSNPASPTTRIRVKSRSDMEASLESNLIARESLFSRSVASLGASGRPPFNSHRSLPSLFNKASYISTAAAPKRTTNVVVPSSTLVSPVVYNTPSAIVSPTVDASHPLDETAPERSSSGNSFRSDYTSQMVDGDEWFPASDLVLTEAAAKSMEAHVK